MRITEYKECAKCAHSECIGGVCMCPGIAVRQEGNKCFSFRKKTKVSKKDLKDLDKILITWKDPDFEEKLEALCERLGNSSTFRLW